MNTYAAGEDRAKRILVVDDEADFREILSEILQLEGFSTETAADGSEALGMMSNGRSYDLVLSDINMPYIDGLELLSEIRRKHAGVKVILITGTGVRCADGAEAVLPKPLDFGSLLENINTALDGGRKTLALST